ncbi:MAG: hypothetical protein IJ056_02295 [Acidaminococcaceae bacterium]|nr:hypothetical protein [Acidaminococcaceae bacterium]
MGLLKKAACATVAMMLLCPAPGQAARASSPEQDKQPVITLGDRPAAEVIRQKQGAQPVIEKT